MNIFISSTFESKYKMREVASRLVSLGFNVVSSWIFSNVTSRPNDPDYFTKWAKTDISDLVMSDTVLVDLDSGPSPGKHFEYGYAKALGIPVNLIGRPFHVFHHLEDVVRFDSWDDYFEYCNSHPITDRLSQ